MPETYREVERGRNYYRSQVMKLRAEVAHWRTNAANTVSKALYNEVCASVDRLQAQRDELLEAAKDMVSLWDRVHPNVVLGRPSLNKARAAIRRAEEVDDGSMGR